MCMYSCVVYSQRIPSCTHESRLHTSATRGRGSRCVKDFKQHTSNRVHLEIHILNQKWFGVSQCGFPFWMLLSRNRILSVFGDNFLSRVFRAYAEMSTHHHLMGTARSRVHVKCTREMRREPEINILNEIARACIEHTAAWWAYMNTRFYVFHTKIPV